MTALRKLPARLSLGSGTHEAQEKLKQACVMEAVAWVAGEQWSDHPECACPVIGAFLRSWNDSLPDNATRDRLLKPLVLRLVGSKASPDIESRRGWMAFDWLTRVHTPAFLELAGLKDHAQLLRDMGELRDSASAKLAKPRITAAGAAAGVAARVAARDAARVAAGVAARDAAWAAARVAARDAARVAAGVAARVAAGVAARVAARDAARVAAGVAARVALDPTVRTLQASALELIDRMLEAA